MRQSNVSLAALALCSALVSCAPAEEPRSAPPEVGSASPDVSSGSCGVERWAVKTGTDSAASQVNMTPQSTTISSLRAIAVPSGFGANSTRFTYAGSPEIQNFKLTNVTLTQYKLENDSDYHLIVSDGTNTMIAEIPYQGCLSGGPFAAGINTSRNAFDAKYAVTTSFQTANAVVTITGVGFFDVLHGQTGVAPNGIELHAVQSICWGTNCSGGSTPDFSLASSPASVSGAGTSTISATPSGGFSGTISLSASGAPAGATATLSSTSISGSGSSTLTLTPGSAAAGTYPITVTGTSGGTTHTASVSWTIAGSGGGGALTNGGFESGLTGWTSAGTNSTSSTSHSGTASAQVGSANPGTDSSLAQTFTLPASATTLSFWYRVVCTDTITYDWATATLKDNTSGTTTTVLAKTCTNSGAWVQASASVTGGHSVTLTLSNHDDNNPGDPTYTLYDDVAVTGGTTDTTPPTATVTAPASGSTVSGSVTVTATATDNVGVTKIELYVDGALLASGATSPESAAWNTAGAANGSHTLTAKAYDAAGNVGTSAAVTVTVSNSGPPPNPIVNGGFETGSLSGWTSVGTTAARPYPHTGTYSAALGSSSPTNGDSSISQTFTVPAGASSLSFWYKITCPDQVTYDWATATLTDNTAGGTTTLLAPTCTNTNAWVQATSSLTSLVGHSVTLTLTNHDDNYSGDATYTDYDDVTVQ